MSDATTETSREVRLRRDAETRLRAGTAASTTGWTVSPEALSLLYRLASDPDTAGDALKLLHELQAHQVELDLQHGQMEVDRRELADDLARYRALFDCAPMAYFVCDVDGRIIESNPAGARLLGVAPTEFGGRPFADFLVPASRHGLSEWLQAVRTFASSRSREVRPAVADDASRTWRITATALPGDDAMLLVAVEQVEPGDG